MRHEVSVFMWQIKKTITLNQCSSEIGRTSKRAHRTRPLSELTHKTECGSAEHTASQITNQIENNSIEKHFGE